MKRSIKLIVLPALVALAPDLPGQDFQLLTGDGLPDVGRGSTVWADFNNDSYPDVAISGINAGAGNWESGIYINNKNGTFGNSGTGLAALADGSMAAGDINNDGLIDLLINGRDDTGARVTKLYRNNGGGIFVEVAAGLTGLAFGGAALGDIDNDGLDDILISGIDNANARVTRIYMNNGGENFTEAAGIGGMSDGGLLVRDLDNDGFPDIIINGLDASNRIRTLVYHNDQSGNFVLSSIALPQLRAGKFAAADVNADGYADIFVSGIDNSGTAVSAVYANNAGAGFTLWQSLPGLGDGAGAWADYDHNGYYDLLFFGYNNPDLSTYLYANNGTTLTDSGVILPGCTTGTVSWTDYNNDNKPDLLLNGYTVGSGGIFNNIYRNITATANTIPLPPTSLTATSSLTNSVRLEWGPGSDAETNSQGLTYELYVGTSPGAMDVVRPGSDVSGFRKVVAPGDFQSGVTITGLPEGRYYWSVQSIDAAHAGSPFAAEQQFAVCDPVSIAASDVVVCPSSTITLEAGSVADNVEWFSVKNTGTPFASGYQAGFTVEEKDTLYVEVTKPLGCLLRDTVVMDVFPIPAVDLGDDRAVCSDEQVTLTVGSFPGQVRWYTPADPGTTLGNGTDLLLAVSSNNDIVAALEDLNGCVNTDTVAVASIARPVVDLGAGVSGCPEALHLFDVTADSVNWYTERKGQVAVNSGQYQHTIGEDDKVWAEVYNAARCISYDTVPVHLHAVPVADAGEDKFLCDDKQSVQLGAAGQDVTGLTFAWTPAASLDDDRAAGPIASPAAETTYALLVVDMNGCEDRDTVFVGINPPSVLDAGNDAAICYGDSVQLGGTPTAQGSVLPYVFDWSPKAAIDDAADSNPWVYPVASTTYRLITSTGGCVIDTSFVSVTVHPLPEIVAGEDVIAGFKETVPLLATGGVSYEWSPPDGLDNDRIPNPVAAPAQTTTYVVTGIDTNGCRNTDDVTVSLRSEVFVPNLFTPNGDGNNDIFMVYGFGIARLTLKVFDRSGQLVYESSNDRHGWDGTIGGREARSGDYLWAITGEHFDGRPVDFNGKNSGIVRLIR